MQLKPNRFAHFAGKLRNEVLPVLGIRNRFQDETMFVGFSAPNCLESICGNECRTAMRVLKNLRCDFEGGSK
jgi:hypothetical protein